MAPAPAGAHAQPGANHPGGKLRHQALPAPEVFHLADPGGAQLSRLSAHVLPAGAPLAAQPDLDEEKPLVRRRSIAPAQGARGGVALEELREGRFSGAAWGCDNP